jgi:hypothetical protein
MCRRSKKSLNLGIDVYLSQIEELRNWGIEEFLNSEFGIRNAEFGMRNAEVGIMTGIGDWGIEKLNRQNTFNS